MKKGEKERQWSESGNDEKMWTNKTLNVEQWATDITAASITINRVIVPAGSRPSQTEKRRWRLTKRHGTEKLANTQIASSMSSSSSPLSSLSSLSSSSLWGRKQNVESLCRNSGLTPRTSEESRRTVELTEKDVCYSQDKDFRSLPG